MKYMRPCVSSQDSQNKRQQILDAAYIVFSRKGYHRATVDEIIALADTGKGTVYNYFVNKEQLFYTLIKERSTPFETILENIIASPDIPFKKIEVVIKAFLEFYRDNADLWRVVMHEVRGFSVEGYSNFPIEQRVKYQTCFCQTIGMIEKVLLEAKEQGLIQGRCDANRAAHSLFSVIVTAVFRDFIDNDIDGTAQRIAEIFLYGVASK